MQQGAETKATYNEIQQYALKQTGLMVSNLYIAQVKKMCGIEVGKALINLSLRIQSSRNVRRRRKKQLRMHLSILA